MKKKYALALAAAAMVGTLAVGGTLAWFTDTETATNVVTMGNVDITLSENGGEDGVIEEDGLKYKDIMPGDKFQKTVTIKNNENDAYVRAVITVSGDEAVMATFGDEKAENDIKFAGLDENAKWTKNEDGSYSTTVYYKNSASNNIMTNGENVVFTVFTDIQIPGEEWDNVFANNSFNIKVDAEAIQAANLTEEDAWKAMTK